MGTETIIKDFKTERNQMVETQIAARGTCDPTVLAAMRVVPREAFMPESAVPFAYGDEALAIAEGQTISQPYIVALMTEAVAPKPGDRALEIGTDSGYAAVVLAHIVSAVYTVERLAGLAESAARRLAALGYENVHVRCSDGTLGWPEHAPYDAIIVTAGGPRVRRRFSTSSPLVDVSSCLSVRRRASNASCGSSEPPRTHTRTSGSRKSPSCL